MSPLTCSASGYGFLRRLAKRALSLAVAAVLATPAVAEVRILAFGDSLTAGYGLPEGQGFVPQLDAWLAAHGAEDVVVLNGGVSGETSAGGLARIAWALQDNVDGVIVELGANDLLRGIDPAVTKQNLDGILSAISAKDLPSIVAGLPAPPNYPEDYRRAYKAMFRDVAEQYGAIYYPSFFAGMGAGRGMREVMALMQQDGMHPNAEGVAAIVGDIGPVVLDLVARARAR